MTNLSNIVDKVCYCIPIKNYTGIFVFYYDEIRKSIFCGIIIYDTVDVLFVQDQ